MTISLLPKQSLPLDKAITIELVESFLIFRASGLVQSQIDTLSVRQIAGILITEQGLDCSEEIDDYLSLVNRMVRNISMSPA